MKDIYDLTILVETCVSFIACILFAGIYAIAAPWQKSMSGRNAMYLAVSCAAVLFVSVLRYWLGDYTFRKPLLIICFTLVTFAFCSRLYMLIRYQILGKQQPFKIVEREEYVSLVKKASLADTAREPQPVDSPQSTKEREFLDE